MLRQHSGISLQHSTRFAALWIVVWPTWLVFCKRQSGKLWQPKRYSDAQQLRSKLHVRHKLLVILDGAVSVYVLLL